MPVVVFAVERGGELRCPGVFAGDGSGEEDHRHHVPQIGEVVSNGHQRPGACCLFRSVRFQQRREVLLEAEEYGEGLGVLDDGWRYSACEIGSAGRRTVVGSWPGG
ncbi:hypothetical protein [Streptomyces atratus]|uniref:hypothetical protein n=1 Tax=Streptomyces atratus TaxID=1893 RepID=UPI0033FB0FF9